MHMKRLRLVLSAAGLVVAVTGCQTMVDQRGNLPDAEKVARITPGVTKKDTVTELLGTPSSVGTFDDHTWYYISKRTEQWAFLEPKTVDQQVVIVDFDDQGTVKDIRRTGLDDHRDIVPNARSTPSPGHELSFFEQLFGNLGKFNNPTPRAAQGP
jgi:outer membrane protein assembly factor BamE (lipoprotein component of BamABCDE complex)